VERWEQRVEEQRQAWENLQQVDNNEINEETRGGKKKRKKKEKLQGKESRRLEVNKTGGKIRKRNTLR